MQVNNIELTNSLLLTVSVEIGSRYILKDYAELLQPYSTRSMQILKRSRSPFNNFHSNANMQITMALISLVIIYDIPINSGLSA